MPEVVRVQGKDFGPLAELMLEKDIVGLKLNGEKRVGGADVDSFEVIDVTNLLDDGSEGSLRACLNYGVTQQKGVHCRFDYQICEDYVSVLLSQAIDLDFLGAGLLDNDPYIIPLPVLSPFPTLLYPVVISGVVCSVNDTLVYPALIFSNPQWGLLFTNNTGPSSVSDISIVGHFTRGAVGVIRSQNVQFTSSAIATNNTNATTSRASTLTSDKPFIISDVRNSVGVAVRVSEDVEIHNFHFFNTPDGIQLQRSQNVIISENKFENLFRGVVACDFIAKDNDKWFQECPIVDVSETTPGNPSCPSSAGDYSVIAQNISIQYNDFSEISDQAIQLDRSNLVSIEDNKMTFLSLQTKSISLTYGCLNSFANNSVTDGGNGALFRTQNELKVSENTFILTSGWAVSVANRSQNVEIYSNTFSGTRGLLVAVTEKLSILNNVFDTLDDVSVVQDDGSVTCPNVNVRDLGVLRLEIPLQAVVEGNYIGNSPLGGIVIAGGTYVNVSKNTVVNATSFCFAITSSPYEIQRSSTDIQIYNSICRNDNQQEDPVWGVLVTSPDTELYNIAIFNNQIHEVECGGLLIKSTHPILPFFFVYNDVFLLRKVDALFYDLRITNGAVTLQNNIFFSPLNTSSVTTNPGCPDSDSDVDTESPTSCPHLSSLVFSNNYYASSYLTSSSTPDDSTSYITEVSPYVYDFINDVDSIGYTALPEDLSVNEDANIGVSIVNDVAGSAKDYFGNFRPFVQPSVGLFQFQAIVPPTPSPTPTPTIPPSPTPTPTRLPPPTFAPFPTPTPVPVPTPFFRKPTPFPTPTPTEFVVVPPIPETTKCADLEAAQECVDAHIALTCLAYPEDPDLQCECVQDGVSGVNTYDCVAIQNCLCGDEDAAKEFWTTLAGNCHIRPTAISCLANSNPGPCLASQGFQCSSTYSQLACNRLDKCSCYPDAIGPDDCEAVFNCNCGSFIRSSYYWDSVATACSSDTDKLSCPILTKNRQSVDN